MNDETISIEVIRSLLDAGVSAPVLSKALGIPLQELHSLFPNYDDREELIDSATSLAYDALEEGRKILRSGSPAMRSRFILAIFNRVFAQFGSQPPKVLDEMRDELDKLFSSMTTSADEPESIYASPEEVESDNA